MTRTTACADSTSSEIPKIEVSNVDMIYRSARGPVPALRSMQLTVRPGSFVSLLGPSGCGKSTLMMLVAGLRQRTSGSIRVDGSEVNRPRTDVGIVFQKDVLLDWRSNLDNVLLQVEMRRLRKRDYRPRAEELLESVGLGGFERRRPGELSGGMRQRVAICRALIHDPSILLMDEPFGALDALTREQMMVDLQSLTQQRQSTTLFITHSIAEAIYLSDEVVVMTPRPGRVAAVILIDLPRPRSIDVTTTAPFNDYVEHIRNIFSEIGVLREHEHERND